MRIPQERDVISTRRVVQATVVITVLSAVYVLLAWGVDSCGPAALPTPWANIPEEINQVEVARFDEPTAAERSNSNVRERLKRYSWVDPQAGVVAIPIDKAAEIYLARSRRGAR